MWKNDRIFINASLWFYTDNCQREDNTSFVDDTTSEDY